MASSAQARSSRKGKNSHRRGRYPTQAEMSTQWYPNPYRSTYRKPAAVTMRGITESKYVDGYKDQTDLHDLQNSTDDTWADTEFNPRQQTAVYGCLPVPRQGTNYADRDGRKIFVKTIRIKGLIVWEAGADLASHVISPVRVVIVKDTRTNGTELSGENVIGAGLGSDGMATLSGNGGAICLPTNPDGWGRYKILYDNTFMPPVQPQSGDSTNLDVAGYQMPFDIVVRPKCYINFDASTGAIGSIIDNSFHVLAATVGSGTVNAGMRYYARTVFVG